MQTPIDRGDQPRKFPTIPPEQVHEEHALERAAFEGRMGHSLEEELQVLLQNSSDRRS